MPRRAVASTGERRGAAISEGGVIGRGDVVTVATVQAGLVRRSGSGGCRKLAIVGSFDGTHVGGSFRRAAHELGIEPIAFDVAGARGNRFVNSVLWRFGDRRPSRLRRFSAAVVEQCERCRPDVLIATGAAPLSSAALEALRQTGILCINYSTDDPWNPALHAGWHLRALPKYGVVFTTRRANIADLSGIGCGNVRYLPFAYDATLFRASADASTGPVPDVLFVGGADRDRLAFITEFLCSGLRVSLVGGYWRRFPATRPYALGQKAPEMLAALTAAAKINLCLVRRANRDGHVMRSFEIAAVGGCMLAEDTAEHREIFGADGDAVAYFRGPRQAAERARALIADAAERARLAAAARARIEAGAHTYRDRLLAILADPAVARRAGAYGRDRGAAMQPMVTDR